MFKSIFPYLSSQMLKNEKGFKFVYCSKFKLVHGNGMEIEQESKEISQSKVSILEGHTKSVGSLHCFYS